MKTFQICVLALLATLLASCTMAPPRAVGDWHGTMHTPRGDFSVVVRIAEQTGKLQGTLESPDQAPGQKIPITITELGPERLRFEIASLQARFDGTWNAKEASWQGTWQQSGYTFPLVLRAGPAASMIAGLDGTWQASVQREDRAYRLILRIQMTPNGTMIKFDAPDYGAMDLAVTNFSRQQALVHFEVPATGAKFDGTLTSSLDRMSGTWYFPNRPTVQVAFVRGQQSAQAARKMRPQTPKPPFQYSVEGVSVTNHAASGTTLACTLTRPNSADPVPAVALVTGSGSHDRDASFDEHKPFAVIADHLTRNGFAVLRCDDRGIGKSTGSFETLTTLDSASDASAGVAYLASRKDISSSSIGLMGHSEGGLASVIAASANPQVKFLVLLGAPATNLKQMLLTQRRLIAAAQGLSQADVLSSEPIISRIFDAVASAESNEEAAQRVRSVLTPDALKALRMPESERESFVQQMANTWMRHFLRLDPAIFLSKIHVPVLALNGSVDRQVEPHANLAAIKSNLPPETQVTTTELPGLNHMFQTAKTGAPNEYGVLEESIAPSALESVTAWMKRLLLQ